MTERPDRELNEKTVENVRDTLKTLWQIGMLGAMFEVAKRYGESFGAIDEASRFTSQFVQRIFSDDSLYFVSFVLCFLRFFVGDSRMLDLSYVESTRRDGFQKTMRKFTPTKQALDLALLVTHAFFFHLMAVNIEKHTTYLSFFFGLSAVNIAWLGLALYKEGGVKDRTDLLTGLKKNWQIRFWASNNAVWLALFVTTQYVAPHLQNPWSEHMICIVCLLYSIANSVIDFVFTRHFYFPKLHLLAVKGSPVDEPVLNLAAGREEPRRRYGEPGVAVRRS